MNWQAAWGVVVLVVFVALIWFVISRARKGYQMLSAAMEAAAHATASSSSDASSASNVNVHVGHALGNQTAHLNGPAAVPESASWDHWESTDRTLEPAPDYEALVASRLAQAERSIREEVAHQSLGLPTGPSDPALGHPARGGRSGGARSSFFSRVGSDNNDDRPRHLFEFDDSTDEHDVVGHVLAAQLDADNSADVHDIGGSFDWFDAEWRERTLRERGDRDRVPSRSDRGRGGGR